MEVSWKKAEGYSRYLISNLGQVCDTVSGKEVSQVLTGLPKYYYVNVYNDSGKRKLVRVHRLVALAFIEKRGEGFDIVDHIDRNPHNNVVTNLRWVNRSGNARNTDLSLWVGDVHLVDFVKKYENPEAAYSHITYNCRRMDISACILKYEEYLKYGKRRMKVFLNGSEVYLSDLCEEFGVEYHKAYAQLRGGKSIWNILIGAERSYPHSLQIPTEKGVHVWFKSKEALREHLGYPESLLNEKLKCGINSMEDFEPYDPKDKFRIVVKGIRGTREELCSHFGVTVSAVTSRMKKGLSFEEALLAPQEKFKYVTVDGVRTTIKELCGMLGVNNKNVTAFRRRTGCTLEEAIARYGGDTRHLKIEY